MFSQLYAQSYQYNHQYLLLQMHFVYKEKDEFIAEFRSAEKVAKKMRRKNVKVNTFRNNNNI